MSVVVLGGGVSGLSAAHYLKTSGLASRILVLEASDRLGGWVNSKRYEDGIIYEMGPRTLRVAYNAGANTLALAETLNLTEKIINVSYGHPSTKNRMIQVEGKLHKLPNSLPGILKKVPPFTKPLVMAALHDIRAKKVVNEDESLYSFVNRRFGSEVAKYAIDPLARGVFAGNAKDLSVTSLARRMHEVEQKYGSVLKGFLKDRKNSEKPDPELMKSPLVQRARKEKWAVWSLEGGLETLIESLEQSNSRDGVEIRTNTEVKGISKNGNRLIIQTDNEEFCADRVISCLPTCNLKSVIRNLSPELATLVGFIPFATVAVVSLEYDGQVLQEPAFGYLVPSSQPNKVLGVVFDTCTFPQNNQTILTVMMGGYWFRELFGDSPSEDNLLKIALEEIKNSLSISNDPVRFHVSIQKDCIPQYIVGHSQAVTNARKLIGDLKIPLALAGNSYDGAGVNDAIISAKRAFLQ
ncbi:unnamed protein product, partial [Meganyctiphanes norvegica]